MSNKNLNIYNQIVDMELQDLENKMILLQNQLIGDYDVLDEIFRKISLCEDKRLNINKLLEGRVCISGIRSPQ